MRASSEFLVPRELSISSEMHLKEVLFHVALYMFPHPSLYFPELINLKRQLPSFKNLCESSQLFDSVSLDLRDRVKFKDLKTASKMVR